MKSLSDWIVLFLIVGILSYCIYEFIKPDPEPVPDRSAEILKLEKEKELLKKNESLLLLKSDSLSAVIKSLDEDLRILNRDLVKKENEINEILAGDSTKAIEVNRKALRDIGIQTSGGPFLTNFEMGWNSKLIYELIGMRLKVNNLEKFKSDAFNIFDLKDSLLAVKDLQLERSDSLSGIFKDQTKFLKSKIEKFESFWFDRFIIYGGCGLNYSEDKVFPGIQIGMGFKFYSFNLFGD